MYGRVILGTDGTAPARRAGAVASTIAKATSSHLVAVTAYRLPMGVEDSLASALDAAEAGGMQRARLSSVSRQGPPPDVLVSVADEQDAGLIVASRGRGGNFALSDVTRRLVHKTPCDLLIVADGRRDPSSAYASVLIASDGSATADRGSPPATSGRS